jgi:hypothetical protein
MHVNVLLKTLGALASVDEAADSLGETRRFYDLKAQLQSGLRAAKLQQKKFTL